MQNLQLDEPAKTTAIAVTSAAKDTTTINTSDTSASLLTSEIEDENVQFLLTCFPTIPAHELVEALESQDNDVEKATDLLLNREYVQSGDYAPENAKTGNLRSEVLPEQNRRKKNSNKNKNSTNTVWSSGQLPTIASSQGNASNPGAVAQNMRSIMAKQQAEEEAEYYQHELATVPFNFWHQYDPLIKKLQSYFPTVPYSTILHCTQHCRGNMIASVKLLMEKHPESHPEHELTWPVLKQCIQVKKDLGLIMEDRSSEEVANVALGVVLQHKDDKKPKTIEQLVQIGIEHFLSFDVSQIELEARLKKIARENELIHAKAKKRDIPVIPDYLLIHNQDSYIEDDPEDCRDIAMQLILERNELFKKAAAAYRAAKNKGPGEGGIAFYYSDTARQLDAQAKDWNMRAARATVRRHRVKEMDDHLLDLHGLTVAEAQVLTREGLNQWYSRSQMQAARKQFRPLKIITGAGKHSQYGEAKLLPSVLKILKKEGWRYEMPHPGCIYVKGVINRE
ncbi:hypothetical protein BDF20DRAFT_863806 [Mycotypha africana]|uniref:uncharacterized protein n=1 Tax=Mycotypha africana TaxID=64632 RepID=UPI00230061F1|nr:uncharacterized protein BDF20DRAFT_863806 [Mycotypha africana]KAI8981893.1 hypothetical protein BDF20DRAFT_863806 [Mycotypha africana]